MKRLFFIMILFLLSVVLFSQTLEIKETTNYYDGNIVIVGLVMNNTESVVSFVSLSLVCRNEKEETMHTDSTYVFAPIIVGWEMPFKFLLSESEAEGVSACEISIDNYYVGGIGTFYFEIGQVYITEQNSLFHKYSGEIVNLNDESVQYVKVAFMGFDENNKLVFYDSVYAKKNVMKSGDKSLFVVMIPPEISNKMKSYKCFAYAK